MQLFITRLAERGPVRVLDGGNQFNAYLIARQLHGRPDLLDRISISRMFTCYQVLASLDTREYRTMIFIRNSRVRLILSGSIRIPYDGQPKSASSTLRGLKRERGSLPAQRDATGAFEQTGFENGTKDPGEVQNCEQPELSKQKTLPREFLKILRAAFF